MSRRRYGPARLLPAALLVALAACTAPAVQHNPACPDLAQWPAERLHGRWAVELPELNQRGQLVLRRHPEFQASLRGEFRYGGHLSIASGDLEGGRFVLDESVDGKSYYAFWTGALDVASCGQEIRGRWERLPRAEQPALRSDFVLRRLSSAGAGGGW